MELAQEALSAAAAAPADERRRHGHWGGEPKEQAGCLLQVRCDAGWQYCEPGRDYCTQAPAASAASVLALLGDGAANCARRFRAVVHASGSAANARRRAARCRLLALEQVPDRAHHSPTESD